MAGKASFKSPIWRCPGAFLTNLENPREGFIHHSLVVLITASGLLGEKPLVS